MLEFFRIAESSPPYQIQYLDFFYLAYMAAESTKLIRAVTECKPAYQGRDGRHSFCVTHPFDAAGLVRCLPAHITRSRYYIKLQLHCTSNPTINCAQLLSSVGKIKNRFISPINYLKNQEESQCFRLLYYMKIQMRMRSIRLLGCSRVPSNGLLVYSVIRNSGSFFWGR